MLALDVGPEALNTSSRVMTIFTGRPHLRDSASATGSMKIVVLPPNPPPISEAVTRSPLVSSPSSAAHSFCTFQWPWVQHHNSPLPSAPSVPRQAWGSI